MCRLAAAPRRRCLPPLIAAAPAPPPLPVPARCCPSHPTATQQTIADLLHIMIRIHEYLGRKSEDKPLVVGWRKSIKSLD
jgi:hypothetical protein